MYGHAEQNVPNSIPYPNQQMYFHPQNSFNQAHLPSNQHWEQFEEEKMKKTEKEKKQKKEHKTEDKS